MTSNKSLLGFGIKYEVAPACIRQKCAGHWRCSHNGCGGRPIRLHFKMRRVSANSLGPDHLCNEAHICMPMRSIRLNAEVTGAGGLFDSRAILTASRVAALRNATHLLVNRIRNDSLSHVAASRNQAPSCALAVRIGGRGTYRAASAGHRCCLHIGCARPRSP